MRTFLVTLGAVLALSAGMARAGAVADPALDFLSGYNGPKTADMDIVSFSALYDPTSQTFAVGARFAGDIDPSSPGFYVIGIDTGLGASHPFGPVGEGNVLFDQAATVQKSGVGAITVLGVPQSFTATISGDHFSAVIPLAFLPTTGFAPENYGFSLWSRQVVGGLLSLADFAPENATLSAAPEPGAWALMITGFGLAGAALRRRRRLAA